MRPWVPIAEQLAETDAAAASAPMPIIWLVSTGRDPSLLKRMSLALVLEGLQAAVQLTESELDRYAERTPTSQVDILVYACDLAREDCWVLRKLSRKMPYVQHLIVSDLSNPVAVRRALDLGARGLVDQSQLEQTLGAAVRAVSAGLVALSPEVRALAAKPVFTHREKQALALVTDGLSNGEIATHLGVSESTLKSHLASAFAKLGVHSRAEAAALILDRESGLATVALPPRRRAFTRAGAPPAW